MDGRAVQDDLSPDRKRFLRLQSIRRLPPYRPPLPHLRQDRPGHQKIRKRRGSLDPRRFPQKSITQHLPHRGEQACAPRRICRLRRQTGSGTSHRIFCPTGRKQTLRTTIDAKTYIIVKPRRVSRRARREKILIINRRDMRVAIYSSRSANVRAYGACAAAERTPPFKKERLSLGGTS